MRGQSLFAAGAALFLTVTISACGASSSKLTGTTTDAATTETTTDTASQTQDSNAYNDLPLGRSITVSDTTTNNSGNDQAWTMTVVVDSPRVSRRAVQEFGAAPKHTYVGLRVAYTCSKGTCSYNPYDFTMRGASGDEFDSTYDGFEPMLASGDLRAGRKARGYITYDLASGQYTLEYRTGITDINSASWVVTVK